MLSEKKVFKIISDLFDNRAEFKELRQFKQLNLKLDAIVVELQAVRTELVGLRTQPVPNYVITALESVTKSLQEMVK